MRQRIQKPTFPVTNDPSIYHANHAHPQIKKPNAVGLGMNETGREAGKRIEGEDLPNSLRADP